MINMLLSKMVIKKLDSQLNKELQKANSIHKNKYNTVVCKYCGQLLPKQEAGAMWDITNQQLYYFHEDCFNKNEKQGTLEDLKNEEK